MIRLAAVAIALGLALLLLTVATYHGPAEHRGPFTPTWTAP